jgi:hypothetical protein
VLRAFEGIVMASGSLGSRVERAAEAARTASAS